MWLFSIYLFSQILVVLHVVIVHCFYMTILHLYSLVQS